MKILQVYNRPLGKGGEEFVVNTIDRLFGASGQFVTHFFNSSDWVGPDAPPKWKQGLWTLYNPQSAATMRKLQQQTHADAWLFHGVFPIGSPSIFREAIRQRVPVIQYVHNFRPFSISPYSVPAENEPPISRYLRTFAHEIRSGAWQDSRVKTAALGVALLSLHLRWLRVVKAWITLTNVMRNKFIEGGIPAANVFTLPYPWTPIPNPTHPPEQNHYLFLGRLSEEKGVPVLCSAWEIIRQKLGTDGPKLIIGGSGPLDDFVALESKKNPLIDFRGVIGGNEKIEAINTCRAMIAPSVWSEPRAIVTYEAYDYSKPMLASRAGGFTETVIDGTTGLLHTPGNAEQLADQVIQLNQAAELRRQMGLAGRKWLLAQPTPSQWLDQFRKIVGHAKQSTRERTLQ
jgi:glycosyltransferase involved in cell wall biosynthesis